ncbi:MAG: DegT/DnrJ/EryC1/StrS aminotransferase family protein [Hyphomicrobiales bacterium]
MKFIDLAAQQNRIKSKLDVRIQDVLAHGAYIMGPEVAEFESKLGSFCGAKHTLTCANGTDALQLAMMALEIGADDAVFVPSFTFAASAEVVPGQNATPIFVDVNPETFNIDAESLKRAILHAREIGLNPKAVVCVDLFGLAADFSTIGKIAQDEGLYIIDDAAQGFGAIFDNRMTGTLADITTTSFFPAKPLGCYGDGGAIFTDNEIYAERIDSLRIHGKGTEKYDNARIGMNSRLDTLQAAILLEKLAVYEDEIEKRQVVADRYTQGLKSIVKTPHVPENCRSIWAQYTVSLETNKAREALRTYLGDHNIPSVVYYPKPLHLQPAYAEFPRDPNGLQVSEHLCKTVLSLPMHPYLTEGEQDFVVEAIKNYFYERHQSL